MLIYPVHPRLPAIVLALSSPKILPAFQHPQPCPEARQLLPASPLPLPAARYGLSPTI